MAQTQFSAVIALNGLYNEIYVFTFISTLLVLKHVPETRLNTKV